MNQLNLFVLFCRILDYCHSELYKIRRQNGELKVESNKMKKENKKLANFQNLFDVAITVSNWKIVQLGRLNQDLAVEVASKKHKVTVLACK